jgi:AraC-like DNA-binding protein
MAHTSYFQIMLMVAPALCSMACTLFVVMMLADYPKSKQRKNKIVVAALFLITTLLWLAGLALEQPGFATRFVLGVAAVVVPTSQIVATHRLARRAATERAAAAVAKPTPVVKSPKEDKTKNEPAPNLSHKLSTNKLEGYFLLQRPYLNPDYRLTDLANAMNVNSSDMSAFINRTYGMGFKRYINQWRLIEYDKMMALPSNRLKNPYRLIKMAGFTDPRHYHRVVRQEKQQQ